MSPIVTVLQLDTQFPRVPGDVACPETYTGDIEIIRIPGATVEHIVSGRPDLIDIAPFEIAVRQAAGEVIVTSCGFLSYWQDHLAALTPRPFISSALTALTTLSQRYAADEVLTLTFDESSLSPAHFGAFGDFAVNVVGLPAKLHLRQVISQDLIELDIGQAGQELADFIATKHSARHKHLLLECTNLPPYKAALQRTMGLEITDILTQIENARQGTVRQEHLS